MGEAPYLRDLVEPSDFVSAYRKLAPTEYIGRLAPSLGLLIIHKLYRPTYAISKEFVEPELFLGMTELPPFIEALKDVNSTLQASSGSITLPLTQEMGFGKTHFEALLFHLYTEVPRRWSQITSKVELEDAVEKLTVEALYKPSEAERTVVLALDLKSLPDLMDPYGALFESCARIIKEYKRLDARLADLIRGLGKMRPERAATELAGYIKRSGYRTPFLILIDELYAKVFETAKGGDREQIESLEGLLTFLTSFIDSLKEHSPVALVYASAKQDIETWDSLARLKEQLFQSQPAVASLVTVVEYFKDRTSRARVPVKEITPEDAMEVVLRRLIRFKAPRHEITKPIAECLMSAVRAMLDDEAAQRYYGQLLKTYPFVPTYGYLARKLMTPTVGGDLPRTQHVRDLLKISASLVAKVYEGGEWERSSLITPAYLAHEDVNHLMDERYSMEWGRLYSICRDSLLEVREEETRLLAERMLSVVYLKSLTTNILKLLDAIRSPQVIPREEILLRGTSMEDLAFSLVGAVPNESLAKFRDAYDRVSKAPSIIDVEHEAKKYLLISFVINPADLVESFKREEMARFKTPDGAIEARRMVDYFRDHLEREYALTGEFAKRSEEAGRPKLALINYDTFFRVDERGKPGFLRYLDRDRFTALVITPWSIANKLLEGGVDPAEEVREVLQKFKGEIDYPNMLGVVVPAIEAELLQRLCSRMAEIQAAKRVVSYLGVKEAEERKRRRLELARRAPTYETLVELLRERFEDIILEVMDTLQNKIEEYAKSYTNTAVEDYTSELLGSFKHIIYLDLGKDLFIKDKIGDKYGFR